MTHETRARARARKFIQLSDLTIWRPGPLVSTDNTSVITFYIIRSAYEKAAEASIVPFSQLN